MKVAIVIPVYKSILSPSEKKSLLRCKEILSEYDCYLACYQNLKLNHYIENFPQLKTVFFEKKYFESLKGYNKLLLSPAFYEAFNNYDYVLIYQLDAYVFENNLMEWCQKGYDYIGAPWIIKPPVTKKKPIFDMSGWFINQVGNGGLSLRKVKSHIKILKIYRPIISLFIKNEDMFYGVLVNFLYPFFKKPKVKEALSFAMELEPKKCYEINGSKLPFGVHAWEKYDPLFWAKFIP